VCWSNEFIGEHWSVFRGDGLLRLTHLCEEFPDITYCGLAIQVVRAGCPCLLREGSARGDPSTESE